MIPLPKFGGPSRFAFRVLIDESPATLATERRMQDRGFTLVEVMISMGLALIVMAAMMSTFLYLGRNLNRLANQNQLDSAARLTLSQFARDVRQAEAASNPADLVDPTNSPTDTAVKLWNIPTTGGGVTNVTYSYDSVTRTLNRADSASSTSKLMLKHVRSFDLNYYNSWGLPQASASAPYNQSSIPNTLSVKSVELRFTTRMGDQNNNTAGAITPVQAGVSPRLALRNRTLPE